MVTLTYNLMIDDQEGEMIEQVTTERPLQFLYGAGMMLPKFESQLAGLKPGESFEIKLNHKDAYGEVNEDAIVDLPKNIFEVDGKFDDDFIKEGNTIPMMTGSGQRINGLVLQVDEQSVRMDFNHPLAGEDLHFQGEVVDVRAATDEEIVSILTGKGGCSSGGCGCSDGGCSSGSCGTDYESDDCGCGCGC